MFTCTHRTRMLAAAALAAATLTLTACNNGEGVTDEGASTDSSATATTDSTTASPEASGASKGSTGGAAGSSGGTGSSGSSGSTPSSGTSGSTGGSADSASDSSATTVACAKTSTRTTATEVSRPLNHVLLTVTNTGSKNCTLIDYPAVRFGEAQSVPPVFEDSMPQAVVTLAPGESGYASVLLSAADGSGSNGYTAKSLEVYFNSAANTAATPSLPAKGVYVDDSIRVSYWQSTMADALTW
ncbi:DUF4232 domain-containing protein [Streptomyces sp. NBC_00124]|uniref:DUF4232 domain-containing protein n=1 Tax=Streptomyces sp. NBC_00124 TaxID=2975662 RepID=UPI00225A5164|nr:DUF4232 domain-containing protein [Streptomyces sp. NBC_00124]MCX5362080.1 DUF4232 domain-containing protein [Streptomyces sp. NBC_00124]